MEMMPVNNQPAAFFYCKKHITCCYHKLHY